ncbi:MAG: hypothetical protein JWN25_1967 [Verrucomicrobiales bacterium]|nr:hypothetical protein [Verrucomicrobiales bacterium]
MKHQFLKTGAVLFLSFSAALAADLPARNTAASYVGFASCSSTSCHGGASDNKNQCIVWSRLDFHSRSFATLNSARSERLSEVLKINKASTSERCTVCHAPFQSIPDKLLKPGIERDHGVSCEICHAPAQNWLRSHTRADFTRKDRAADGMADLQDFYVRANTCVACHQVVDKELLAAGHPELIFEMDGQSVTEPRHWKEKDPAFRAKGWAVAQAVALREIRTQLASDPAPSESLVAKWNGLSWLLQKISSQPVTPHQASLAKPTKEAIETTLKTADDFARAYAEKQLSSQDTKTLLAGLLATSSDFGNSAVPQKIQARRAERLVLGIDRLTAGLSEAELKTLNPKIQSLFKQVQSLPDFQPTAFGKTLDSLTQK